MFFVSKAVSLIALVQVVAIASPARRQAAASRYIFSFGDSYTASGFDINGAQPSPANPMGNPPLGQPFTGSQPGTMSGGMNYIDWLTSHYNTTETYTFDFAHSQATVSNNLSPVDGVPSFEDQVATLYKPKYSDKPADVAPWTGDNTIFTVFFGINDIQNNYKTGAIDTFIPQTLDLYFAQIQALYDTGARKLVFVGVPPLDRSPRVMQEDPSGAGTWSQWQTNYNAQLAQRANDFGGSHSDAQIAIYDFNVFFASVLDDPVGHGFNDATCVGDGVKCIWNDIFHPTYTFDFLWAGDMLNILKNVDW